MDDINFNFKAFAAVDIVKRYDFRMNAAYVNSVMPSVMLLRFANIAVCIIKTEGPSSLDHYQNWSAGQRGQDENVSNF